MSLTRTINADRRLAPDPDALARKEASLAARWGDLEVSEPNPNTGSVRIVQVAPPRRSWRVTAQNVLIGEPPSKWGKGRNRS